eukprot:COSAG01_NODE_21200_length_913_cov_1.584767_3_plen_50_part_01
MLPVRELASRYKSGDAIVASFGRPTHISRDLYMSVRFFFYSKDFHNVNTV